MKVRKLHFKVRINVLSETEYLRIINRAKVLGFENFKIESFPNNFDFSDSYVRLFTTRVPQLLNGQFFIPSLTFHFSGFDSCSIIYPKTIVESSFFLTANKAQLEQLGFVMADDFECLYKKVLLDI